MERIEKTVFLSYRRTNIPWALVIFQNLTQHGFDVFFDYNAFPCPADVFRTGALRRPWGLVAPRDRDRSG